jgi:hypothetical protein
MAVVVVLIPVSGDPPALRADALERLAELGVTSVTLLRDDTTAGLVLEGWALDAPRVEEAACWLTTPCDGARPLRQIAQMSVSTRTKNEEAQI